MVIRDVYKGQQGEWRGGMWIPDHPPLTFESTTVLSKVWEQHTRDIGEERIERIRKEFGKQCEEYNLRRAQIIREEKERQAFYVVVLVVVVFLSLWTIRLLWGVI
jgi:hypothetical protein